MRPRLERRHQGLDAVSKSGRCLRGYELVPFVLGSASSCVVLEFVFSQEATPARQLSNIILSATQDVSDPRLPSAARRNQKTERPKQGGITYLTQGGQQ